MLYDPKWDKQAETKADPASLHTLIAWLETKPPEEAYSYWQPKTCLLAQYLHALGEPRYDLSSAEARAFFGDDGRIVCGSELQRDWTFGAALERARAALADQ